MEYPTHLETPSSPVHTAKTLAYERSKASFSVKDMAEFIMTKDYLERKDKVMRIFRAEPENFDRSNTYFQSRKEKLDAAFRSEKRLIELMKEGKISHEDTVVTITLLGEIGPLGLHRLMFIPTLEAQASDEQQEVFLKQARNYEIIGCYAQTEIGHGSNLKGLETTATFIEETDEFEINSPTLTSTKWWVGSLGITCTHAMVMVQLYIKGKHYGIRPILVPIRSTETHKPLPGVTVGDVGPKFGANTIDNGFVIFDHVRVPRFNLLQRYINVARDGTVTIPKDADPKIIFGIMVATRVDIVYNMSHDIIKAATIGARYTSVRRQLTDKADKAPVPEGSESPILDYSMVQYRLIPVVAKAYAMLATTHIIFDKYNKYMDQVSKGDFSMMKEIHATSCALKRWTTESCVQGIETCKNICGGHGFSQFSGLNELYVNTYPNVTWEGDNYVLCQQTAQYLIKTIKAIRAGKRVEDNGSTGFLKQYVSGKLVKSQFSRMSVSQLAASPDAQLELLAYRAAAMADDMLVGMEKRGRTWNQSLVKMPRLSDAYCDYIVASYFRQHIESLPKNSPLRPALYQLGSVLFLYTLANTTGDLLRLPGNLFTSEWADDIEPELLKTTEIIREQAVPLVDAFEVPDERLNSALGRSDGQVYENYLKMAMSDPINSGETADKIRQLWWDQYLGPVVKGNGNLASRL
ncbi:hypothetical protein H4219_001629 [Mycoemilia scoparia]|uniref:Acyl-coenzyme A oxidase n=1 Tax=Mycoemilia scoparia TaxID=417184 RepID=A0A9W8DV42_9FUNG|nr:hypothetical protein H4219_001629 [Mycoemilia scoparia]